MALFKQLSRSEIEREFTHYGRFCGLLPCYVTLEHYGGVKLQERNWIPYPVFWLVQWLYGSFVFLMSCVDDEYEAGWPIQITGEILPKGSQ